MHKHSISSKINKLIGRMVPGHVFTTQDLLRFGSRPAVANTLSRLAKTGKIARIGQGMYHVPKISPLLGPLSPSADQIAQAMGRQTRSVIQPVGAAAANALGLSTQVPARAVYATNGTPRRRRIGSTTIELRHAGPRTLAGAGTKAGSAVHALRFLGKRGTTPEVIRQLDRVLDTSDRRQLQKLIPQMPEWMRPVAGWLVNPSQSPPELK